MAVTKSGIASWGVTGSATGVTGIITSIEDGAEYIMAPEHNEIGQVVKQALYDTQKTATFTVEVAAGTNIPGKGTVITVNGQSMYIKTARKLEDNNSYRRIQITAEAYENCSSVSIVN